MSLLLALVAPALCLVQDPEPVPGSRSPYADGGQRAFTIGRIDREHAPRIDASLADPCWADAPVIGPLIGIEPAEGVVPEQRTVVRVLHDDVAIYLAIECWDTRADAIRASQRERDARLDPDDRVEFLFDPFGNSNIGYWFQIGAGGSRGDALVGNNGNSFNKSWDTIWSGRSRVGDDGWFAEVAIPFDSISFEDGKADWRFNLRRLRRSDNAEYRWSGSRQAVQFFRLSESGTIRGIGAIDHGIGVDFVPYAKLSRGRARLQGRGWSSDADAGGEVYYRITPSMTAVATLFTDFAETENDERQINLTRFPLFFPEKRGFFLQDSARFDFGPGGRGPGRNPTLIPFFSRRIGLADGAEVPILAGVKVAGQAGPWEVGLLSALTESRAGIVDDDRDLSVLRVTHKLGVESRIGGIVTHGRPVGPGDNTLFGFDMSHRIPQVLGDQELRLSAFGLGTVTSDAGGEGSAWGASAIADGREWDWAMGTKWITDGFNPELGFVRRRGIKEFETSVGWQPRLDDHGPVRNWRFGVEAREILDESNVTTDRELEIQPFGFEMHSGDGLRIELERAFESLEEPFEIFTDVEVAPGDYWTSRVETTIETSEGRACSGRITLSYGDLYDGESYSVSADVNWRVAPIAVVGSRFSTTRARLRDGRFESLVGESRLDLHFSPDLSLRNLVQFDNDSDLIGLQSRLRWIVDPGSDLFLVVTSGWVQSEHGGFRPDEQEVTVKVSHTIRF